MKGHKLCTAFAVHIALGLFIYATTASAAIGLSIPVLPLQTADALQPQHHSQALSADDLDLDNVDIIAETDKVLGETEALAKKAWPALQPLITFVEKLINKLIPVPWGKLSESETDFVGLL